MNKTAITDKTCPICDATMELRATSKTVTFRDVKIEYSADLSYCNICEIESGSIEQTASIQKQISNKYRQTQELLSGEEVKNLRANKGWSQAKLAEQMGVGIASIKRWESVDIQSRAMDNHLRHHLQPGACCSDFTGNRDFSIARIKLVANAFERELGKTLLVEGDKFLFTAKYTWYADMLAFRELGRSMTGATYAAITYGPQLNNYRDLIEEIMQADTDSVEPLSKKETQIIKAIALKFPVPQQVYDAAHKEQAWAEQSIGSIIPYSSSRILTEV
jgi:putative zinc finger/helix-turn-helix YgiT family protein